MKPFLSLAFLIAALVANAEITNPCEQPINQSTKLPSDWLQDTWNAKTGKIQLIGRPDGKGQDIRILADNGSTLFFNGVGVKSEAGEKFKWVVELKGKGKFRIGYIGYNSGKFLFDSFKDYEASPELKKFECEMTVQNGKDFTTDLIRMAILVSEGADVTIVSVREVRVEE